MTPAAELARRLEISLEAVELCRDADFIDLHLDGFILTRSIGYDLFKEHPRPIGGGRFFGHLDFPRCDDAGLTGAMWSITTNPFRTKRSRDRVLQKNLRALRAHIEGGQGARIVRTKSEYDQARAAGEHAVLVVLQGGNALSAEHGYADAIEDDLVVAVTPLHLTHSFLGRSSTPIPFAPEPLTPQGEALIESLNAHRIFVDLAHIHPDGFWRVVDVADKTQPILDTHTGVTGVTPHWRNIDDKQIKAIADTGGVVGVIFQVGFLTRKGGPRDEMMIVEHIEHLIDVGGEDVVALGSDYDGAIVPPKSLRDGRAFPLLIDRLLARGHSEARIRKILGENFLRAFAQLRP